MRLYPERASVFWLLCDSDEERLARLAFHLAEDDYFPFLATVVGMFAEGGTEEQRAFADELRADLLHLHERYRIVPREKPLSYTREKVVRFSEVLDGEPR